jgi:hypothetical protein
MNQISQIMLVNLSNINKKRAIITTERPKDVVDKFVSGESQLSILKIPKIKSKVIG